MYILVVLVMYKHIFLINAITLLKLRVILLHAWVTLTEFGYNSVYVLLGCIAPKDFKIIRRSNLSILSVLGVTYSRSTFDFERTWCNLFQEYVRL